MNPFPRAWRAFTYMVRDVFTEPNVRCTCMFIASGASYRWFPNENCPACFPKERA